jgi:hypothetical protein
MKREFIYEQRQTTSGMMAFMVVVSCVALLAAIIAFFKYGWFSSLGLLIAGSIAFALSRLFDLIGDLFASIHYQDEGGKTRSAEKAQPQT